MEIKHRLLRRQLRRAFGDEPAIPPEWREFVENVDHAYLDFDDNRSMLVRSLELNSEELFAANAELRALFQGIPDTLFHLDQDGVIRSHKSGAEGGLAGHLPPMIGRPATELTDDPAARGRIAEALRQIQATRKVASLEFPVRLGAAEQTVEARFVPQPRSMTVVILRDVTERQRAGAVRARLEHQLLQAQKMEAIGALAGGIAHDFNNILTGIIGNAEMVREELPASAPAREWMGEILNASFRATELVRQILIFSRRQEQQRELIRPAPVVWEALRLLRATLPSTVELRLDLPEGDADSPILADPTQIHQIVMNLCTNSWHSMEGAHGRIEIQQQTVAIDEKLAALNSDLHEGPYVRLAVTDNGCGMDAPTLERIFDPFFSTKSAGRGTGLGLAVVETIMQKHEGAIMVRSAPGQGTTFELFFPAQEAETQAPPTIDPGVPMGQGQMILFVDDEPAVVRVSRRMIERLGYRVAAYEHPHEAMARFQAGPADFAAAVVDLTMPGMEGVDLARRLLELRPRFPVIVATGYTGAMSLEHAQSLGVRELLFKPVTTRMLGEALYRVLDGK